MEQEQQGDNIVVAPVEDATQVRFGHASHAAGGVTAVVKSLEPTVRKMGLGRGVRTWLNINQKDGFDCPSCAWPDPEHRHGFEFCENGAKAVADEATGKHADPDFFARHSVADLSRWLDRDLNDAGRLTHPLVLRPGSTHYEPISWDDAFALVARELNALGSPDEALFYTSGRTSNEAAFLYQLFARQFGTNNLPDCSNMCHESSGAALNGALGFGKSTVSLEDLESADAIFVIGQNPGTNHPRMLTSLQIAARNGAKIVSVNPLPEVALQRFKHPQEVSGIIGGGTPLECLHLPVRINGDVALLKGILKAMREAGAMDSDFIATYTSGYEAFAADLESTNWTEIIEHSGVDESDIRQAAQIASTCERMVVCWAMGLTQHKNGVANIEYLVNFALMRGMIGKPGAGLFCVRGHSNVQGDRTMGIWEKMPDTFLDALGKEFDFSPPRKHGLDTVDGLHAMLDGNVKVFFGMGGNFLSATPDTHATARALQGCRLTVHVSTKLNRAHLVTGRSALILPCLGRTERDVQNGVPQFVTVEDSVNQVHASQGKLVPASEYLLSEVAIVCHLAQATLGNRSTVRWADLARDYDRIRDHIARVVPGLSDYNQRIRVPGGFPLPNPPRERRFTTPDGKAHFSVAPIPLHNLKPGELLMMTIRSHDQFNTTVYGNDDRYRGVYNGRRVVFLSEADVQERGLQAGQLVDLVSHFEGEERIAPGFAVVPYRIPRRCAATYFPEANVLVPLRSVAETSNTPTSKSVVITVRPATQS